MLEYELALAVLGDIVGVMWAILSYGQERISCPPPPRVFQSAQSLKADFNLENSRPCTVPLGYNAVSKRRPHITLFSPLFWVVCCCWLRTKETAASGEEA